MTTQILNITKFCLNNIIKYLDIYYFYQEVHIAMEISKRNFKKLYLAIEYVLSSKPLQK